MEAIFCNLNRAKEWGFITSFTISGRGDEEMEVPYTNDNLILYDANQEHLEHLSRSFMQFEAILGLKINLENSKFIPIGREKGVGNVEDLAIVFCIQPVYLGL